MTTWKSGMLLTAARLADDTPITTTSGIVVASGFTLNDFDGHRVGNAITLRIYLQRSGADIVATTGNITDTLACTVPSGWRPTVGTTAFAFDTGSECGGGVVGTDGLTTLRTATDTINTGANVRITVSFIVD